MKDNAPVYHLPSVRDLLLAAYANATLLARFLLYAGHAELESARHEFGPNDGLATMIDKLIEHCAARELLPDLLAAIRQDNPAQYERFAAKLLTTPVRGRIRKISLRVEVSDITAFPADVLALKFADALYGADQVVAHALGMRIEEMEEAMPSLWKSMVVPSKGRVVAAHVLFVNVGDLFRFNYEGIRQFARQVLNALAHSSPPVRHLAMTVHGVNYGLDVTEALRSQLAGYLDAFGEGGYPTQLERISVVERNPALAARLQTVLDAAIPEGTVELLAGQPATKGGMAEAAPFMAEVGRASAEKPYVYVAMSQTDEMEDIYYYGVQKPVNAAGYLCETAVATASRGDLDRMLSKIEGATIVVAELTGADPNVLLQVGYAWGRKRPTILLVQDPDRLPPSLSTQEAVVYRRIRDLETALATALHEAV